MDQYNKSIFAQGSSTMPNAYEEVEQSVSEKGSELLIQEDGSYRFLCFSFNVSRAYCFLLCESYRPEV